MKIAVLGASRGLGREFVRYLSREASVTDVLALSRKEPRLKDLAAEIPQLRWQLISADVATESGQQAAIGAVVDFAPNQVFVFVGGGPFGDFAAKEWKDHAWALAATYIFPARLLHALAQASSFRRDGRVVITGSAIAEGRGDPGGASYAAAKHALLGLHRSLKAENFPLDVRLFSPGYMDTGLLPPNSYPRREGLKLVDPACAARDLWNWAQSDDRQGHYEYL